MPPKHVHKGRAWGTRYDTLITSPTTSPPTIQAQVTTMTPQTPASHHMSDDKNVDVGGTAPRSEKPRNDSSIFVGSLPTNMVPEDVACALSQHLAEHSEIVHIKATTDKKGGMCAFIQCQDDEAATSLLQTLRNTHQRPFMGRALRFERARSPRALLMSYRLPSRPVYPNSGFDTTDDPDSTNDSLPKAMRIVRLPHAKCTFLWDTSAIEYDESLHGIEQLAISDNVVAKNVLFNPLKFDAKTLREIAEAFGPLEHFTPYEIASQDDDGVSGGEQARIPEHSGVRAPDMESGIWEVKWQQREDCSAALSILRHAMPHISLTWAHHHTAQGGQDMRYSSPMSSPSPHSNFRNRYPRQHPYVNSAGAYYRMGDQTPSAASHTAISPSRLRFSSHGSSSSVTSPGMKYWAPTYSSPQLRVPPSPTDRGDAHNTTDSTLVPDWADDDPSSMHSGEWASEPLYPRSSGLALPWNSRENREDELSIGGSAMSPSPSSSLSVQPATPMSSKVLDDDESEADSVHPLEEDPGHAESTAGRNTNPSTPGFSHSSLTPLTPKTNHSVPQTPLSSANVSLPSVAPPGQTPVFQTTPKKLGRFGYRGDTYRDTMEFDPQSIWVGGLDTSRWSEARIRTVFEKYGNIEDLEFHARKMPSFAFVKFSGLESSTRAVSAENDRTYDGRPIRVAIRQLNGLARGSPMRYSRGRGRQRTTDLPYQRLRGSEGNTAFSSAEQSPKPSASDDPFKVSHGSPGSVSRFSNKREHGEGHSRAANHSSPAASGPPRNQPYPINTGRDGSSSAVSSVSPAPSSVGPSSTVSAPAPYYYYPYGPPVMYPYGYPVPAPAVIPYAHPMQPSSAGSNGSEQPPTMPWMAAGQMQKAPATGHASPQGEGGQVPVMHQPNMQPPLHPTGFYRNEQGALVAMYPPEDLRDYQMMKEGQSGPNSAPPSATIQQQQPPPQAAWYPPMPMMQYPQYSYAPVAYPPGQYPPMAQSAGGWGPQPYAPYAMQQQPPPPAGQYPVHQPQMMPSMSATSVHSVSSSSSAGGPHSMPPYVDQNVGPRHNMMNRRFSRNHQNFGQNRNFSQRFNNRGGYPGEQGGQGYMDAPPHGPQ